MREICSKSVRNTADSQCFSGLHFVNYGNIEPLNLVFLFLNIWATVFLPYVCNMYIMFL